MENEKYFNPYKLFVGSFIPNCLMQYKSLSQSGKLCWARLAQYAGENGTAYPKLETLAKEIGVSQHQVIQVVKELEKKGFIEKIKATGKNRLLHKTNRYKFLFHEIFKIGFLTCGGDENPTSGDDENPTSGDDENPTSSLRERKSKERKSIERNIYNVSTPKFSKDSNPYQLSKILGELILKRKPDFSIILKEKDKNWQNWAKHIDLMLRSDGARDEKNKPLGISYERIKKVIKWCQEDNFWQNNILSTAKLRKQFDKLELKSLEIRNKKYTGGEKENGRKREQGKYAHLGEEIGG